MFATVIIFTVGVASAFADEKYPNTSNLSNSEIQSIESACSNDKYLNGPAAYNQCLTNQLKQYANAGSKRPSLSGLSNSEIQSIESACSNDKYLNGPAAYNQCLTNQLNQLSKLQNFDKKNEKDGGNLKISNSDSSTREINITSIQCSKNQKQIYWNNCFGEIVFDDGGKYTGEWKEGKINGNGIYVTSDGRNFEGFWKNGEIQEKYKIKFNILADKNFETKKIEQERQQLVEERRKFEEEKRNREQARNAQRINLQISNTQPNNDGDFVINIQTGTDTASLKINGEEQGGRADGSYAIKRVARAGQATQFTILAKDIYGNTDSKTIAVTRQVTASNTIKYAELNPALVKTQPSKDAVAIIIGIQNYKRVPKAEFANNDAQAFYDYAIRALGVKPENIKLLVDEQADEVEILSAFQNWLPVKVRKQKTDVYVYYSGHGLPSDDGNSLYILPHGADKQFIAKTAINQQEVVAALQAAQPKSVTMFMDACYSGQIRTGENLIASARPIAIKSNAQLFPAEFTVITASQSDQIASSSADFKHGIFSYYLMKGMEGDADENKDNKITVGEMQNYLQDMVGRKAMSVNRKQIPQLTGDANRVLVGK